MRVPGKIPPTPDGIILFVEGGGGGQRLITLRLSAEREQYFLELELHVYKNIDYLLLDNISGCFLYLIIVYI